MQENGAAQSSASDGRSSLGMRVGPIKAQCIKVWQMLKLSIVSFMLAISNCLAKITRMIKSTEFDEFLTYVPKRDKVVEGVLLLLERAIEAGQPLAAEGLLATMYLADKAHLDEFGRPVFFDNYVARTNGPVGVAAMEMLDPNFDWSSMGSERAPWISKDVSGVSYLQPSRAPNMRRLSETDGEALASALAMVVNLDAGQLRLFTHRNEAYATAWNDGKGDGSRLDPWLIPDERDDEMIDDLLYASRHAYNAPSRQ